MAEASRLSRASHRGRADLLRDRDGPSDLPHDQRVLWPTSTRSRRAPITRSPSRASLLVRLRCSTPGSTERCSRGPILSWRPPLHPLLAISFGYHSPSPLSLCPPLFSSTSSFLSNCPLQPRSAPSCAITSPVALSARPSATHRCAALCSLSPSFTCARALPHPLRATILSTSCPRSPRRGPRRGALSRRVKRRPETGEASSSSSARLRTGFRNGSPVMSLPFSLAAAASIWAIRSGVSSSAFSSSIF